MHGTPPLTIAAIVVLAPLLALVALRPGGSFAAPPGSPNPPPGFVDLHTHCAHDMTSLSVEAEPIAARSGVTTWVDAGSFGPDQVKGFERFIVAPAQVRKFGFVHLYANLRNPMSMRFSTFVVERSKRRQQCSITATSCLA
jgi:hypothetical protein